MARSSIAAAAPVTRAPAGDLRRLFPTPREVVDADLSGIGMPAARVTALKNVAADALADARLLTGAGSISKRQLRGFGRLVGSATGPRTTSRCAHVASPTRFPQAMSGFCAARRTRPAGGRLQSSYWNGRRIGAHGGRMRRTCCGPPTPAAAGRHETTPDDRAAGNAAAPSPLDAGAPPRTPARSLAGFPCPAPLSRRRARARLNGLPE